MLFKVTMHPVISCFLLASISSHSAGSERPDFDEFARPGVEQKEEDLDRELLALTRTIAEGLGVPIGSTQIDLELSTVYNDLYTRRWKPDYSKTKLTKAGADLGVPGIVFGYLISLADVDNRIAIDQAFLDQGNNNSDNNSFVKDRLKELKAIRTYMASLVDEHIRSEISKGNIIYTEHFNREEFLKVESEAKAAAERLSKIRKQVQQDKQALAEFTKAKSDYKKKLVSLQELKIQEHRTKERMKFHQDLANTISNEELESVKNGDFAVVAIQIREQYYGGFGNLSAGQKTTLGNRDLYWFVVDEEGVLSGKIAQWERERKRDWCLGTTDGVSPSFIRGELVYPAYYTGLDKREASKIKTQMLKLAQSRGLKLTNQGWLGPMHGVSVPFVIPQSAKDIPKCE